MDAGEDILDPDNNNSNKDNGTGDHKNDQNTTDRGDSALTGGDTTVEDAVTKQNSRPAYPTDKCCAMPGSTIPTGF